MVWIDQLAHAELLGQGPWSTSYIFEFLLNTNSSRASLTVFPLLYGIFS